MIRNFFNKKKMLWQYFYPSEEDKLKNLEDQIILAENHLNGLKRQKEEMLRVSIPPPPPPPFPFPNSILPRPNEEIGLIRKILLTCKGRDDKAPETPVNEFSRLYKGKDIKEVLQSISEARKFKVNQLPPPDENITGMMAVHHELKTKYFEPFEVVH